jgi:hypothetical protein
LALFWPPDVNLRASTLPKDLLPGFDLLPHNNQPRGESDLAHAKFAVFSVSQKNTLSPYSINLIIFLNVRYRMAHGHRALMTFKAR